MNPIKAVYCRAVQLVLRAALPILPYREPEIFRSCAELRAVFTKKNIQRVLIVTDEGIVRSGIAGQLEAALNDGRTELAVRIGYWGQNGQSDIESAVARIREEWGLTEKMPWLVNYYPEEGPVGLVEFLLQPTEEELAAFAAAHLEDDAGEEENQPDETLEEDATGAIEKESEEN